MKEQKSRKVNVTEITIGEIGDTEVKPGTDITIGDVEDVGDVDLKIKIFAKNVT